MAFSFSAGSLESGKSISISWNSYASASKYQVYVNNYLKTTTTSRSYSGTLDNAYSSVAIKVVALSSSGGTLSTITKTLYRTQFVSFSSSGISCSLSWTDGFGFSNSFSITTSNPSASFQAKSASASSIYYASGYTTPITWKYNTSSGSYSSTTISNGGSNSIDISTYNRSIIVNAAQSGLKYYFKCLSGMSSYQVQVYTGSTLRETRTCYNGAELTVSEITSANSVYIVNPVAATGYTSPYYVYFDTNSSYQSSSPTALSSDNEVSWHNRVRRVQVSATVKPETKYYYKIICDGNGGYTQSGASTYTYPTSGSYTTSSSTVSYPLSNFTQTWTRSGYTFVGWKKASSSTVYTESDYITLNAGEGIVASNTLYAVWKENPNYYYKIRCNGNGGYTQSGASTYTYPTSGSYSTKNTTVSYPLSNFTQTWSRTGYTFVGWKKSNSSTIYSESDYITLTASSSVYTNDLYAVWSKNSISKFYWDGGTGSSDTSYIAKGKPITNLTAAMWNRLRAKIKEVSTAQGISYSYTTRSSGQTFTASDFNDARSAISNLPGVSSLPSAQSKGNKILASYFVGSGSLREALNAAITTYNNS